MSSGTILCVDDDSTVLTALRALLGKEMRGTVIEIAESGEEAVEICEEMRLMGRPVGVVVSDYIMPGMRGDELLVRLHQTDPKAMKIMLTGQSDLAGVKRTINEANLYRFLEKPFLNEDIVLTVNAALRAYSRDRELGMQIDHLLKTKANLEAKVATMTKELDELRARVA